MTAEERKMKAEALIGKYPKKLVDFARETTDYFQYDSNGSCTNQYEVVEEMYGYARSELRVRISIDDFNDLVNAVRTVDKAAA